MSLQLSISSSIHLPGSSPVLRTLGLNVVDNTIIVTTEASIILYENEEIVTTWILAPGTFTTGFTCPAVASSSNSTGRFWAVVDNYKVITWTRNERFLPDRSIFSSSSTIVKVHPFQNFAICSLENNHLTTVLQDPTHPHSTSLEQASVIPLSVGLYSSNKAILIDSFYTTLAGSPSLITVTKNPNKSTSVNCYSVDPVNCTVVHQKTFNSIFNDLVCCDISALNRLLLVNRQQIEILSLGLTEAVTVATVKLPYGIKNNPITCSFLSDDSYAVCSNDALIVNQRGVFTPLGDVFEGDLRYVTAMNHKVIIMDDFSVHFISLPYVSCLADLLASSIDVIPDEEFDEENVVEVFYSFLREEDVDLAYGIRFFDYCVEKDIFDIAAAVSFLIPDLPTECTIRALRKLLLADDVTPRFNVQIPWKMFLTSVYQKLGQSTTADFQYTNVKDPVQWWNTHIEPVLANLDNLEPAVEESMEEAPGVRPEIPFVFDKYVAVLSFIHGYSTPMLVAQALKSVIVPSQLPVFIANMTNVVGATIFKSFMHPYVRHGLKCCLPIFVSALIDANVVSLALFPDRNSLIRLNELVLLMLHEASTALEVVGISSAIDVTYRTPMREVYKTEEVLL
ncbi:hypothetical protein GEMRC1_005984 [Eukaryota sp. GEM-RC1]